jgi:putative ABC transport system permease protein
LSAYTFHITLYDLIFLGVLFIGQTFALLLWFTPKINQSANRFLAMALAVVVLWIARILGIDVGLGTYVTHWNWLPLQFSLALGPLIFFYVLKMTIPESEFRWKDLLHFSPLLLELGAHALEVRDSIKTGAATFNTITFQRLNPSLQLLAFISVVLYLYQCHKLIESYYQRLKYNGGDRYRYELRWLHRLLTCLGLFWLLWIPYIAADYFYYHGQLSISANYLLYLLLSVIFIRIAVISHLRLQESVSADAPSFLKPTTPAELKHKGVWLKKSVKTNSY